MSILSPILEPICVPILRGITDRGGQAYAELNLLADTLDPRITFTRASTKTYYGSDGLLKTAAVNECPLEYDPVTLLPVGRSFWGARTNLLTYSGDLTNAIWRRDFTTLGSAVIGPDGANSAVQVLETTDAQYHRIGRQVIPVTSGQSYTVTFLIAKLGRKDVFIRLCTADGATFKNVAFDLDALTVGYAGSGYTGTIIKSGNGFFALSVSTTATATSPEGGVYVCASNAPVTSDSLPGYVGDVTKGLIFYGVKLEAAATPSPYIPTTGSQVTRAADVATVNDLSTLRFNPSEGTLFAEAMQPYAFAASKSVASLNAGANSPRLTLYRQSAGALSAYVLPDNFGTSTGMSYTPGNFWKQAVSYSVADASISTAANGGTAQQHSVTQMVPSTLNTLTVGNAYTSGPEATNGFIRRIRYYPTRLTDAELQALTA